METERIIMENALLTISYLGMGGRDRILSCLTSGKWKAFYFLFLVKLSTILLELFCFLIFSPEKIPCQTVYMYL